MVETVGEIGEQYSVDTPLSSEKQLVPEGYKETEAGIIPDDWTATELGSAIKLQRGFDLPHRHRQKGVVPIVSSSGVTGFHNESKVSAPGVVTGRYGTIGQIFYVEEDFWPLNTTLYVKEYNLTTPQYTFYLLKTVDFEAHSGKSGVPGVNRNDVHQEYIAVPPVLEQTAISNALFDVDELISSLEDLIAKKQAIKTSALQQLLTGCTRLPQFATHPDGHPKGIKQTEFGGIPEDWEVVSLDECTKKVGSGKTPTGGSSVYADSGRPFIRSQNVGWGELDLSDVAHITEETHSTFAGTEILKFDVLLNITGASIGRCAIADERIAGGNVNQHVCIIRTESRRLNPFLLVELMNSRVGQDQIDSYQAGGNREGLNFNQVRSLRFSIALNPEEQTAIANTLSDMDKEIQAFNLRLTKTRQIKQGMMQELLTGRTRLV